MTYDLYYHNDFDGRASAAVILAFFKTTGDRVGRFVPMDYTVKPQWIREDFFKHYSNPFGLAQGKWKKNPPIIVDFLYHPKAAVWFDHHHTTFMKEAWQRAFKASELRAWDKDAPSCCGLVLKHLEKTAGFKPPAHLKELAKWLDIIDSAAYKSAAQTIELKDSAIQINAFLEHYKRGGNKLVWLIKLLSEQPMSEIVKDARVRAGMRELEKQKKRDIAFYKDHIENIGKVIFADLTTYHGADFRFAPYYLSPSSRYGLVFKKKNDSLHKGKSVFHISLGVNPWRKKESKIDMGNILRRYGGGGHKNVGGLELPTRVDVEKAKTEILEYLAKHG